jgi:hypothetical protein
MKDSKRTRTKGGVVRMFQTEIICIVSGLLSLAETGDPGPHAVYSDSY